MSDATRRALRTGYQTLIALLVVAPLLLANLPVEAKAGTIVAAVAIISKVVNALEDAGLIPAWLKDGPSEGVTSGSPEGETQEGDPAV